MNRTTVNACPLIASISEPREKPNYYSQKQQLPIIKKDVVKVFLSGELLDFKQVDSTILQDVSKGCISLLRMCHKRVKMKKLVKSSNKNEVNNMTPSDQQQLKAHLKAAAEIIYRNTDPTELKSFETIEKSVRQKMLSEVGPELGSFFFQQYQELKQENPEK